MAGWVCNNRIKGNQVPVHGFIVATIIRRTEEEELKIRMSTGNG
jgi:hypothetical protein